MPFIVTDVTDWDVVVLRAMARSVGRGGVVACASGVGSRGLKIGFLEKSEIFHCQFKNLYYLCAAFRNL